MALTTRYRRHTGVVSRKVLGETLLVPIRGQLADLQRIFTLNPVAEHIWAYLDGEHDVAAIRDSLVSEFEVQPEEAEADTEEFIAQLAQSGLLAEVT